MRKVALCFSRVCLGFAASLILAAPAASQTAAPIKWRMQTMFASGFAWDVVPKRFAERIKQASGGRLEITPYPADALVPTFQMLGAVRQGAVEMGWAGGSFDVGAVPAQIVMWGVPMTFTENIEEYQHMWWDLGMIDVARAEYAKINIHLLAPLLATPYGSIMSRKPIKSLKDFKGMKLRSFAFAAELGKAFGASVVSVPPGEMYTALASGTIDAAHWAGPDEFYSMKIHEVAKYYLKPAWISHISNSVYVNLDKWKRLPPDLQQIVELAAKAASVESASYGHYLNQVSEARMKAAGVTFTTLPASDLAAMKAATMKILEEKIKADPATAKAAKILKDAMKVYGY
ncbi:MAG: TRAP transporter substrate-binding protein DctP [Betaproteobacteria bacterium]|nr:TRAP transporter substrate-binding protein DctP [Betaproteobacteria bacterium]